MSPDLSSLEADLRQLRAAPLDESLLARLEACAANTWSERDPAQACFEQELQQNSPAPLPPELLASLLDTLRDVPFPGDQKIVRFPQSRTTTPRTHRAWWGAAAAVALTGAVTALLVPAKHQPAQVAANPPAAHTRPTAPATRADKLIPAGFNRSLAETRDEGVIWQSNNQPHRVLKVVYIDSVTLKDAAGRTYQVEQPRVEYILVPAQTD